MKRIAAVAVLALGTLAAAPQDEWEQQVRRMLHEVGRVYEEQGFELTHHVYTGALDEGEIGTLEVTLQGGTEYQIVGVCDTDCSDLDLKLSDAAGNEVALDIDEDDVPIVAVAPGSTGKYTLEVGMSACSEAPCRYGVGGFGR